MKTSFPHWMPPLLAVTGGCAAFFLRLLQNRTGFETETGLPVSGNPAALALFILFAVLCGALALLAFSFPKEAVFSFSAPRRPLQWLYAGGCTLLALSGLADLAGGWKSLRIAGEISALGGSMAESGGINGGMRLLSGALFLLAAGGLFWYALSLRQNPPVMPDKASAKRNAHSEDTSAEIPQSGIALLLMPVAMVARLVAVYRLYSIDPVLEHYVTELLALSLLTLGFYTLSAFPFEAGHPRRFVFYACAAVPFCFCSLADTGESFASLFLYLGGAAVLLGFLLTPSFSASSPSDAPDA